MAGRAGRASAADPAAAGPAVRLPSIDPLPPERDDPPTTTAAITENSSPCAALLLPDESRPATTMPSSAAIRPLVANSRILIRSTLMPVSMAARALPPTAYTERPYTVRLATKAKMTNSSIMTIAAVGTCPTFPPSRSIRALGLMGTGNASVKY